MSQKSKYFPPLHPSPMHTYTHIPKTVSLHPGPNQFEECHSTGLFLLLRVYSLYDFLSILCITQYPRARPWLNASHVSSHLILGSPLSSVHYLYFEENEAKRQDLNPGFSEFLPCALNLNFILRIHCNQGILVLKSMQNTLKRMCNFQHHSQHLLPALLFCIALTASDRQCILLIYLLLSFPTPPAHKIGFRSAGILLFAQHIVGANRYLLSNEQNLLLESH